ncbi:MAG: tryptophan--tRNA ligase, partial [Candidatus Melainabacteria bacterium]|nr:tryptophan--tRNA ligase [Candidatus Melainabacteria bacterium]
EIAELHLLLSMVTYQNWVERDPTLKDMVRLLAEDEEKAKQEITYGLLGYPVLMSADILSVFGELVPVGKDQVAHIELTRDIARRFNHIYKSDLFPEPRPLLTETPSVMGTDGRKMSKSLNNDIKLLDSNEITQKKVLQMITDPNKIKKTDPGEPNNCQVAYKHYEIFADKKTLTTVQDECKGAKIGCVDCKKRLAKIMNAYLAPIREKREGLNNEKEIYEILYTGNKKARQIVQQTLLKVREVMKLKNW